MNELETLEAGKSAQGTRHTNLVWEITQAMIAVATIGSVLYATTKIALNSDMDKTAFIVLSNLGSVIIGFYFGRTNHARPTGLGNDK